MLEDEIELGIHSGKLMFDLANSVLKPLDPLPLVLEPSITIKS